MFTLACGKKLNDTGFSRPPDSIFLPVKLKKGKRYIIEILNEQLWHILQLEQQHKYSGRLAIVLILRNLHLDTIDITGYLARLW